MLKFFKQLFCKHHYVQSRSHPGMLTCKRCRHRKWPG